MNTPPLRTTKDGELESNLCTEAEVMALVHTFYALVRQDEVLAPIFNEHISDWDRHLAKLVDFWSAILRRTGRFSGAPLPKHAVLPGLSAALFQRWLRLFRENAFAQPNQTMARQACAMAERIAQSLWMGYQISRDPEAVPTNLAQDRVA
jgi:hemoglobin